MVPSNTPALVVRVVLVDAAAAAVLVALGAWEVSAELGDEADCFSFFAISRPWMFSLSMCEVWELWM